MEMYQPENTRSPEQNRQVAELRAGFDTFTKIVMTHEGGLVTSVSGDDTVYFSLDGFEYPSSDEPVSTSFTLRPGTNPSLSVLPIRKVSCPGLHIYCPRHDFSFENGMLKTVQTEYPLEQDGSSRRTESFTRYNDESDMETIRKVFAEVPGILASEQKRHTYEIMRIKEQWATEHPSRVRKLTSAFLKLGNRK